MREYKTEPGVEVLLESASTQLDGEEPLTKRTRIGSSGVPPKVQLGVG